MKLQASAKFVEYIPGQCQNCGEILESYESFKNPENLENIPFSKRIFM